MSRFLFVSPILVLLAACRELKVARDDQNVENESVDQPNDLGIDTGDSDDSGDTDTGGTSYTDADQDGYTSKIDCDDNDASINPGTTEVCDDGIDQDCDGSDEECASEVEPDADADGSPDDVDCDDADANVYPGAAEVAGDGIDQDCDGSDLVDVDCDGYTAEVDCNDTDATINPSATEVCGDGIDNDCSGGDVSCSSSDTDGDGSTDDVDCNDADASVYPGASELDNSIDDDCDGSVDEGYDLDGDDYSVAEGDCNDADATVFPDATETCDDGIDNNCDGLDNDADRYVTYYQDADGDGYGSASTGPSAGFDTACAIIAGYVANYSDCDDTDALVNPVASEYSAGIDDEDTDCDGSVDEDWQAYVLVTYRTENYYQLNVQSYDDVDELGDSWDESPPQSFGTQVEVEFLTSEYGDLSSSCGLRLNVSEGNPASDWLCTGYSLNRDIGKEMWVDIWFDGDWYDESDLEVWLAGVISCSAVLVVSTDSDCQV